MLTEIEVETILLNQKTLELVKKLKAEFIKKEAPYLEISDHNFFSLIMMTPTLGMALSDEKITLSEELSLIKKAKKLSKGSYFFKKDPVVHAMGFLIKKFKDWEYEFFEALKQILENTLDTSKLKKEKIDTVEKVEFHEFVSDIFKQPFFLIRFISSYFLENDEDIFSELRKITVQDHELMIKIAEKSGLGDFDFFHKFHKTFIIKN